MNKRKRTNKLLAFLLTLVLAGASLPMTVTAMDSAPSTDSEMEEDHRGADSEAPSTSSRYGSQERRFALESNEKPVAVKSANQQQITSVLDFNYSETVESTGEFYTKLQLAVDAGGGTLTLDDTLDNGTLPTVENVSINSDVTVVIQGSDNGVTLHANGSDRHLEFTIASGRTLTLKFENVTLDGSGSGGGIETVSPGALHLIGAEIQRCKMDEDGGGVFAADGDLTLDGCTFTGNAAKWGGAASVFSGSLTVTNSTFSGNEAQYGGGIYTYGGIMSIADSDFTGNKATGGGAEDNWGGGAYAEEHDVVVTNTTFSNNEANFGGGIFANGYTSGGSVLLEGCAFRSNTAERSGGGIYAKDSVTVEDESQFSENKATYGGGIYAKDSVNVEGESQFSENKATYGGGVYAGKNVTVQGESQFADNEADYGGGVYAYDEDIAVRNSVMKKNIAKMAGGALYAYKGSVIVENGSRFNENEAGIGEDETGHGAGMYVKEGDVSVSDSWFTANKAGNSGGGIFAFGNFLTITNSVFEDNEAMRVSGAGVFVHGGTNGLTSITDSAFTGNVASASGGGLHAYGNVEVTNCVFEENESLRSSAGGMLVYDSSVVEGSLKVSDSVFANNHARSGGAGGIYVAVRTSPFISGSSFIGNTCTARGGGVYIYERLEEATDPLVNCAELTDNTFINNTAGQLGGSVYARSNIAIHTTEGVTSQFITTDDYAVYAEGGNITMTGEPAFFHAEAAVQAAYANTGIITNEMTGKAYGTLESDAAYTLVGTPSLSLSGTTLSIGNLADADAVDSGDLEITLYDSTGKSYDVTATQTGNSATVNLRSMFGVGRHTIDVMQTLAGQYESERSSTVEFSISRSGGSSSSTYTVTFDSNGGTSVSSQSVVRNSTASKPKAPTREGYTFTGWYTDAKCTEEYSFSTAVTANLTLYAGWEKDEWGSEAVKPYIKGYSNGTFRPDDSITRAEAVQMLYNLAESGAAASKSKTVTADGFRDVAAGDWYYDAVMYLVEKGAIQGYPDNRFDPEGKISRAEFTTMAVSFMDLSVGGSVDFPDVSADHWAAGHIASAKRAGLIDGYPNGNFGPDDDVTRAEAATILNRLADRSADPALFDGLRMPFSDVPSTHWAYYQIMAAAVEHQK